MVLAGARFALGADRAEGGPCNTVAAGRAVCFSLPVRAALTRWALDGLGVVVGGFAALSWSAKFYLASGAHCAIWAVRAGGGTLFGVLSERAGDWDLRWVGARPALGALDASICPVARVVTQVTSARIQNNWRLQGTLVA